MPTLTLHAQDIVTPFELEAGRHALVRDAAFAGLTGALSGGVLLVSFALALGAGPVAIGLLAAIPYLAQAAQLPAIFLVERVRERKRLGVLAVTVARVLILATAALPLLDSHALQIGLLVLAQALIAVLGSVGACAINSWFHQLLPSTGLGLFFSRRLVVGTALACGGTLIAGLLVDRLGMANPLHAYAVAFAAAGLAGFASSWYLLRTPEPRMLTAGPRESLVSRMREPWADMNFRRLLLLLAAWNLAVNLAAPFITVYLIQQLGYSLSEVTGLWVASQVANAATLYAWGRLSDRLSNKAVLAVALPVYFACLLGLVFTRVGAAYGLQLALLYAVHLAMGAANGGIALATGNLGLKLAPQGQGTTYLASIGMASALAGGVAPVLAGVLAERLQATQLSIVVRWVSSVHSNEVSVLRFAHWEFLFALSALCGLYVMHALSRVREGEEISDRIVMQELALEAMRTVNHLSSIGGVLGSLFSFERLSERRIFMRSEGGRSAPHRFRRRARE